MYTGLSIEVLGRLRAGVFSPCPLHPGSHFQADQVAIASRPWGFPALTLHDSTVSARHALIVKKGGKWDIQDLDSDNGIRSIQLIPGTGMCVETGQQAFRFEFSDEMCCSIGAVVLRLKALRAGIRQQETSSQPTST
jgi:hypothetical protein